jgi:hypothetical protein
VSAKTPGPVSLRKLVAHECAVGLAGGAAHRAEQSQDAFGVLPAVLGVPEDVGVSGPGVLPAT